MASPWVDASCAFSCHERARGRRERVARRTHPHAIPPGLSSAGWGARDRHPARHAPQPDDPRASRVVVREGLGVRYRRRVDRRSAVLRPVGLPDHRHLARRACGKPRFFRDFYIRRIVRIFPLYYLVLFARFAILPRFLPDTAVPFEIAIGFWLYVSNWTDLVMPSVNGFGHFWSLAVEEQFYLGWPLAVSRLGTRGLAWACLALIAISGIARFVIYARSVNPQWLYMSTITRRRCARLRRARRDHDPRWPRAYAARPLPPAGRRHCSRDARRDHGVRARPVALPDIRRDGRLLDLGDPVRGRHRTDRARRDPDTPALGE